MVIQLFFGRFRSPAITYGSLPVALVLLPVTIRLLPVTVSLLPVTLSLLSVTLSLLPVDIVPLSLLTGRALSTYLVLYYPTIYLIINVRR